MNSLGSPDAVSVPENTNRSRLSIAHIMPWSGIGGVEIATLRIVDATRDQFRHVAFCKRDAAMVQAAFAERGVETVLYDPPEPSLRHFLRFYYESRLIARELRKAHVDIAHFAEIKAAAHCGLATMLAGVKRISHVRNTFPRSSLRGKLELSLVQEFVFVSRQSRDFSALPVLGKRVSVLYDAVEVPPLDGLASSCQEVRREFGISPTATIIGTVARVNPQKDYITLAHAAAIVLKQQPNTRFLVVGDNALVDMNRDHYAVVLRLLQELGIADSFVFTGHREDVNRLIAAMDFCVLATHREGFPLSILETMAMGKAVVATEVGGIPEIIEPGKNGYLSPHGDSVALASHLLQLIEHPDQILEMGRYAREQVRRDYSKQGFVEQLFQIYRAAVKA